MISQGSQQPSNKGNATQLGLMLRNTSTGLFNRAVELLIFSNSLLPLQPRAGVLIYYRIVLVDGFNVC